jgi:hypothetical protein
VSKIPALHDVVRLIRPAGGLPEGTRGTIVGVYAMERAYLLEPDDLDAVSGDGTVGVGFDDLVLAKRWKPTGRAAAA